MTTIEGFAADQVISDESADQLKIPKYGNFFIPWKGQKLKKNRLPLNLNRLKTRYLSSILSFPWAQTIQKFV